MYNAPYQCIPNPCGCNTPYYSCPPFPACDTNSPCPIQLDCQCIIYHKFNSETTQLTNLNISNGGTLESILEAIDPYIGQLKINSLSLPYLKGKYVITNFTQFAQSVNTELESVNTTLLTIEGQAPLGRWLGNLSSDPGGSVDGDYWWNTSASGGAGALKIKVNNGVIKTITTS